MSKFLQNIINPADKRYQPKGKDKEQFIFANQKFLSDKTIGEPQATEWYSVEELKAMNMVGVYEEVKE
jgi:hypothetical protein